MPTVRSMSVTETPLLARLTIIDSRSRIPSSVATSRSWTAARRAGTSGVTGTRIRSQRSKIARLSLLYEGCTSTTTKSKPRRAARIASATRSGPRTSVASGVAVSDTTRMPDGCAAAMSVRLSIGPPSSSSRQTSATVRMCSSPSEVETWPVTVSASTSRTCWPLRSWSVAARFVAIVVLPTPPFGLKIATTVARRVHSPDSKSPVWMTGPLPSSTVCERMHIASTRQRSDSTE
jgi:hypothetical protein